MARADTRLEPAPRIPPVDRAQDARARRAAYLRPYRREIVFAAIGLVVAAAAVLAVGQGLKFVVDRGFAASNAGELDRMLALMLVVIVVMAGATYMRFYHVSWLGERVTADLRRAVFDHLLDLPPAFFEATRTGEVISRLINDTTMLETVIGSSASMAIRNFLLMIGGLVMLTLTSAKLTLLVLAGVPLVVVPIVLFGRRVRKLARATPGSRRRRRRVPRRIAARDPHRAGVRARGRAIGSDFATRVEAAFGTAVRRIRQRALLVAAVIVLVFGAVGVILWIGGHDVVAGRLSAGPAFGVRVLRGDRRGRRRLDQRSDRRPAARGGRDRAAVRVARGRAGDPCAGAPGADAGARARHRRVRRRHVPLSVAARHAGARSTSRSTCAQARRSRWSARPAPARRRCSSCCCASTIRRRARCASTASTCARADPRDVRRQLALVPQDPVIFAASVLENVRYGRPDATDAEVQAACDAAYATEFIERLPEGFDGLLGERGVRLSGGQRQRLAIARAILADRPILLLDEATSALDAESERIVQRALERLMAGRTVLIIAHRLATVRHADRIAVMERGRIVALGTHDALVRDNPLYARLAALQFARS